MFLQKLDDGLLTKTMVKFDSLILMHKNHAEHMLRTVIVPIYIYGRITPYDDLQINTILMR